MMLTNRKASKHTSNNTTDDPAACLEDALDLQEPLLGDTSESETGSTSVFDDSAVDGDEEVSMEGSGSKLKLRGTPATGLSFVEGHVGLVGVPHLTRAEQRLQKWLHFANSHLVQTHGVRLLLACLAVVFPILFLFIADAHNLCDFPSKNNCEPRNFLMNLDIQILTGLFTIKAIICFPWRAAALWHLLSNYYSNNNKLSQWIRYNPFFPVRCNVLGYDFFGQLNDEPFFRIPHRPRLFLAFLNVGDCLFQFLNQATRVYFFTYARANTAPGNFWVDLFWPCSLFCGVVGGNVMDRWIQRLNNNDKKTGFENSSSCNNEKQRPAPNTVLDLCRPHEPNACRAATALDQHIREGHYQ